MSKNSAEEVAKEVYGYIPTKSTTIIFIALFGISTLLHMVQMIKSRMWFLLPTVCFCGALEILGWAARLWSSISPQLDTPFTISITGTIIAPTPLIAANFIILSRIIQRLGPVYSRLRPRWYAIIFCVADVVALVIQATGGSIAASASSEHKDSTLGSNITLAGIGFQMAMITLYVLCATEFFVRYIKNAPVREVPPGTASRGLMDRDLLIMSSALGFSTVFLFIRAVYRTIELADGWDGRIFRTEVYFNVLDGAMIVLAMYTFNFAHPGGLLHSEVDLTSTESISMKRQGQPGAPYYSESAQALA